MTSLLIADEVVTGFGRLGTMMGSTHYGIEPDIITIAKGLTSAYAPLSGSIISNKVWKVLEQGTDEFGAIGHGWTYSAHPIGAAAGVANLKLIDSLGLVANAGEIRRLSQQAGMTDALASTRMSATCAAKACSAPSNWSRTSDNRVFFDPASQDRAVHRRSPAQTRRHRPGHAAGRYHRLCAAALPVARRG
jgi:L-2,4-diaminobutyrate transaminase